MDDQAISGAQPLGDAIFAAAEQHAAGKGYTLGEGAEHHFRSMAALAASQIEQMPSGSDEQRAKLDEAIRNFSAMIDAMIEARPAAYAGDPERLNGNIIGEVTLAAAHAKLCPIWPFC